MSFHCNAYFSFVRLIRSPGIRKNMVGLTRLELVTSRLSGVRSNQLSYRPAYSENGSLKTKQYVELTDVRPHLITFLPECVSLERR